MRMIPLPRTITGPIRVERHDEDDGNVIYEIWDHGPKTYHMICSISEVHCDNAKAEADFVALAMSNAIGALIAIERSCDCLMCLAEGDNSPHRRRSTVTSTECVPVPPGHELCSSCGRLFKFGETCTRGGCPCGGDV